MKRQWRKFLWRAKRKQLYESELSYYVVPWLVWYLHKSIKAGCRADVESILDTLWDKHGVTLDGDGNLCFVRGIGGEGENQSGAKRSDKRPKKERSK